VTREFLDPKTPIDGLNGPTVTDYWRWAYSDLLSNLTRSTFAEYLVGVALGVVDKPRVEWDAVDLRYNGFKVKVKASAECQSWFQSRPSPIQFGIGKAVVWDPETGKYEGPRTRCADIYVFCHYTEKDRTKANVLDVPAWDFYVVPTEELTRGFPEAKLIRLVAVKKLAAPCKFPELRATVDGVLAKLKLAEAVSSRS
jgi:hypothetical protein